MFLYKGRCSAAKQGWDTKLKMICRYNASGNWEVVGRKGTGYDGRVRAWGTGYDVRVRAWGTVVPVVPIKLYQKKGHQLNKKVTNFWKLVTFFSKLVTFFWVHMMGTTGTTRGVRVYPAISWKCTFRTLKSVPRKVYQPYPEQRTNRTQQYRSHPRKYPP